MPQYSGFGTKHYGKCGLLHAWRQRIGKGVFTVGKNVITETERLILRQMDLSDFKEIAEMLQDIRVMYAWEYAFSDFPFPLRSSTPTDNRRIELRLVGTFSRL